MNVRDIVRELEEMGWVQVRHVGSHRQFRHPTKLGTVTVPGRMGDELAKGRLVALFDKLNWRGGIDDRVRNRD